MGAKRHKSPDAVSDMPLVVVEWVDAARDPGFDGHPEDVVAGTVTNHTAGFLMRETRTEVVVVTDVTVEERTVRWPYGIPKRLVRRIVRLGDGGWLEKFKAKPENHA